MKVVMIRQPITSGTKQCGRAVRHTYLSSVPPLPHVAAHQEPRGQQNQTAAQPKQQPKGQSQRLLLLIVISVTCAQSTRNGHDKDLPKNVWQLKAIHREETKAIPCEYMKSSWTQLLDAHPGLPCACPLCLPPPGSLGDSVTPGFTPAGAPPAACTCPLSPPPPTTLPPAAAAPVSPTEAGTGYRGAQGSQPAVPAPLPVAVAGAEVLQAASSVPRGPTTHSVTFLNNAQTQDTFRHIPERKAHSSTHLTCFLAA